LEDLHLIEQGTKIQYAKGKLVLVVKPNKNNDSQLLKKLFLENQLFTNERFKKLIINHFAIANPDLAPYGRAAKEVLEKLGVFSILKEKLVMGENIQQTQQLVTTGNAEFALLSLAQVVNTSEVYFIVPEKLFSPIVQEAVVLKSDLSKLKAAKDFLDFLKLDKIKTLIREFGYDTL
jgi:molybdate transport system substrate-binding protein